ncbi:MULTISPECIES: helix-turn-helix domain-containing protein [Thiorhodovibrio]|uniref:helix-turn-helix domain-containing protein n=1 Tax=Thiorhodovibrio TaxID=61593 RepID=UPI001F5DB3B5|nr:MULTISPECIES: helix-turn-helix domain-containing protein [Thiorhodovibrio]WPL11434.1 Hin recombinational enhancer-binding protein [Thiorhodovibrio litoralis]
MRINQAPIADPDTCPDAFPDRHSLPMDQSGQNQEHGIPLRDCVRSAMQSYLARMGDHHIDNLHRFVLDEVERPLVETVLHHCNGNQTLAARILGMSRGTLRKKISQYGLMSANDPRNP